MKVEELVLKAYRNLNDTDIHIWEYIDKNKKQCATYGIDELARACSVSRTTISRFVKKIGTQGYSEFKVILGWDVANNPLIGVKDNSFNLACDSIISYVEHQKESQYEKICELIYNANHNFVYGSGDIQNAVSKQIKRMFLSCGEIIYNFGGITFDEGFYDVVKEGDVIILISLSGNSLKILEIAKRLKLKGIKIISITEFKDNKLTQLSDCSLYISATDLSILDFDRPFKTTMLYFVLAELLFIKYSVYKKQKVLEL